jgi:hypothetical protein
VIINIEDLTPIGSLKHLAIAVNILVLLNNHVNRRAGILVDERLSWADHEHKLVESMKFTGSW